MKMEEQDLIALISGYLDNALSPEDTGRLLEIIRQDPAAADLMCALSIQHVQLRRIFKKDAAAVTRRDFAAASLSGGFRSVLRPLALAASLAVIVAAGFWLAGFLRERYTAPDASIALLKAGEDRKAAADAKTASAGTMLVVLPGTTQLLRFKDGTILELEAGSKAQLVDAGSATSGKSIKLMAGMAMADVTRQPDDFPLKVTTPHLEVIVGGTRFSCKVEEDHTHVRMHQGWAHVVNAIDGIKVKLESGHHVTAGKVFDFRVRSIDEDGH